MYKARLIELLLSGLEYSDSWAIYAELIEGRFRWESPARFGQRQFENGGRLDDCVFFCDNDTATNLMNAYLGRTDGRHEDSITSLDIREAAESLIDEMNRDLR